MNNPHDCADAAAIDDVDVQSSNEVNISVEGASNNVYQFIIDQREFHQHDTNLPDCIQPIITGGDVIVQSVDRTTTTTTTTTTTPESAKQLDAVEAVKLVQRKYDKDAFMFSKMSDEMNEIPIVYPKIVEAPCIPRVRHTSLSEAFQATPGNVNVETSEKATSFDELVDTIKHRGFVSVIGHPGAGKTTLCYRLQKKCRDFLCILVMFMNLNFTISKKMTLRQLILDNNYPELSEEKCELAFKWILNNENKCLVILDGYDQAEWSIRDKVPVINYNKPQTVWDLVSNLCSKKYLPKAHILFTSRPHRMASIPKSVKPDLTFVLQDFTFDDMKKLFYAFAGPDATSIWDKLQALAPQLISSCLNPLMLQLIIQVCTNFIADIGHVTTMTRVFTAVLEDLNLSEHTRYGDISTIIGQLVRLAYNATKRCTVVMSLHDLYDVGLNMEIVQDLVIAQHNQRKGFNKVFKVDPQIYFSHQTLQEYLTALYIKDEMSWKDFKRFVKRDLFTPKWSVVRRFLFGLFLDSKQESSTSPTSTTSPDPQSTLSKIRRRMSFNRSVSDLLENKVKLAKSSIFQRMLHVGEVMQTKEWLVDRLVFPLRKDERDLVDLCIDIRECNDDDVTIKAAALFPTKVDLSYIPLTCSDAHALSCVLMRVTKPIEMLRLPWCRIDSKSFAYISNAIASMNSSISCLDIRSNQLNEDDFNEIDAILPKVCDKLWMEKCFEDGNRRRCANKKERRKLQLQLNAMATNLRIVIGQGDVLEKST